MAITDSLKKSDVLKFLNSVLSTETGSWKPQSAAIVPSYIKVNMNHVGGKRQGG